MQELRRSKRTRTERNFDNDFIAYIVDDDRTGDKCIYSKFNNNEYVIICLYVDDLLIFGTNIDVVHEAKRFISSNFDMKDMGKANVILDIKVLRYDNCITLSQSHYVEKLLKRYKYFDYSPMSTPYDSKIHLVKNHGDSVFVTPPKLTSINLVELLAINPFRSTCN
jgi:hypothetical protein